MMVRQRLQAVDVVYAEAVDVASCLRGQPEHARDGRHRPIVKSVVAATEDGGTSSDRTRKPQGAGACIRAVLAEGN
jgi:hypothetical protein